MSVESLCNSVVDVYKPARTDDGYGSWTTTSDVVYLAMPARLQPLSGQERAMYRRNAVEVTAKLFVPSGYADITEDCWIKDANGKKYDVEFVADIDMMGHHLEIVLREVRTAL